MRVLTRTLSGVFIALALGLLALAQTLNTGTVAGVVSDPSGAAVSGVAVELRDEATKTVRTVATNEVGHYVFVGVPPGTYTVGATAKGFKRAAVTSLVVEVSKSYTVNLHLEIGETIQTVEVLATPAQELQTMDATLGNTLSGQTLLYLPSKSRDVSNLLLLQPLVTPELSSNQGGNSGHVAGTRNDQNTFLLDGGDVTDGIEGTGSYWSANDAQSGTMPAPTESIQEFRVATSNANASFVGSAGGVVMMVTKRGTDTFHGSAYEYLLNSALNANTWDLNRVGRNKPVANDNHFGASLGGWIPLPSKKSRTYFYMNYEGRRQHSGTAVGRAVPSDSLRQGILRFRDAAGNIVSYDLATSMACGPAGNLPCDPRGLGMNPLIRSLWNKYMPAGNTGTGDLNSSSYVSYLPLPLSNNFGVFRLDHSFGDKWQFMSSYRYFGERRARNRQWDIGGLYPGHTLGVPASTSDTPREPRQAVLSLTGTLTPNLTNEFSASYLRDYWAWPTAGEFPQVAGTAAALVGNLMNPMNYEPGNIRQRSWTGHRLDLRENVSWQKSKHFLRFGGSNQRNNVWFWRNDSMGTLVSPSYNVGAVGCAPAGSPGNQCGLTIPETYMPPICSATRTTNCLPSSQINSWQNFYSQALGMVESATQFLTRDANLKPYPPGTPLATFVTFSTRMLYMTDSWRVRPSLTLQLGLNWMVDMPAYEHEGKQIMGITWPDGQLIRDPFGAMATRAQKALNGQAYNPTVAFAPIRYTNRKYPYDPYYGGLAPRVGASWSPRFSGGFLKWLFGEDKTVFRGGFGQIFDRLNGVQRATDPLQALGYGQALACMGPSRITGQCTGPGGTDPSTVFRIGVDGSTVPIPQLSSTTAVPLIPGPAGFPGANQPAGYSTYHFQPNYVPARESAWNFTIQRALPGNAVLEIGYVRKDATNIYASIDYTQPPFMFVYGGQSFAQAFDNVRAALLAGRSVARQPFFDAALAGSSFCNGADCTSRIATQFAGSFTNLGWWGLWNALQPSYVFGPATPTAQVADYVFFAHGGVAHYNAGFVSYRARNWRGLTLEANLTYSHSLDDVVGCRQDCDIGSYNSYDLMYDYGTSNFDHKFVFNLFGLYNLPFKSTNRLANRLVQGWAVAPIFTAFSGLPLRVSDGGAGAILTAPNTFGNSVHRGVTGNAKTGVGIAGDPATGGSGLNLFADPNAVYNSFRPFMISMDQRTGGGGQLRGQARWNLEMGVQRRFQITERFSTTFNANFYNLLNHVEFGDPGLSLQSPNSFGVLGGQANIPRNIELALRVDF